MASHFRLDHVTRNAFAVRKNETLRLARVKVEKGERVIEEKIRLHAAIVRLANPYTRYTGALVGALSDLRLLAANQGHIGNRHFPGLPREAAPPPLVFQLLSMNL